MKTEEDEAFDDIAKRQGAWGGGYQAKRAMAADKLQEPSATRPCRSCGGTGERWTGIDEAPTSICKPCDGTGQIALAQPAQEPVAWIEKDVLPLTHIIKAVVRREKDETYTEPLYTTPPKREWVGLTDDELADLWYKESLDWMEFARAHEDKLKEKNT